MLNKLVDAVGWARIIIALFLFSLFVTAPFVGVSVSTSLSNTLERFGMNGVLVLAMVPMVQSGCGLNFGLPLGLIAGLLGATISIELSAYITSVAAVVGLGNAASFFIFITAICIAVPIAAVLGYFYGHLLNRVKGDEMMIATYVGFSSVSFMCIAWLLLPYRNPTMIWGYGGSGLRTTISVSGFWHRVLSGLWTVKIGNFTIPTGMFLFLGVMCFLVWLFMRTKTGTALTAAGSNREFARASGIDVDRVRIISVVLSTILGAIGILVYIQSFGFIQLYMGPFYMALPAVASILLGGASVNKASIWNVVVGTFLFQGILSMTPSVINSILQTDMSEVIRIIVSNGMILYALTRKVKVKR
ncbi:MAG: ABC transporter permease [Synergistaceae bacterium]|nr:ABC transporter permease [Synergistaceae bacterium]